MESHVVTYTLKNKLLLADPGYYCMSRYILNLRISLPRIKDNFLLDKHLDILYNIVTLKNEESRGSKCLKYCFMPTARVYIASGEQNER